ncbi:hypothetical protein E2C01_069722 [Portunus trituberculatus]|uniref:Uncharacterized protein n=1 Tax=Portunus trituberculatus TaxID=210409 RepID=A0A5B7I060_PORTR|nr:hypothetical protein [Portunus trituberculatus]
MWKRSLLTIVAFRTQGFVVIFLDLKGIALPSLSTWWYVRMMASSSQQCERGLESSSFPPSFLLATLPSCRGVSWGGFASFTTNSVIANNPLIPPIVRGALVFPHHTPGRGDEEKREEISNILVSALESFMNFTIR